MPPFVLGAVSGWLVIELAGLRQSYAVGIIHDSAISC